MTIGTKLKEAFDGLVSLIVGLKITGENFLKPNVTIHYPREVVTPTGLEGYRGHIELVPKENNPFVPKCIACGLCENICPSGCIKIKIVKEPIETKTVHTPHPDIQDTPLDIKHKVAPPPKMRKKLFSFELDYNYCSLCGLCVQNCPAGSLKFSKDIYLAGYSRKEFEFDLLARLQNQARQKQNIED
ncbi:NADH-quinone oxidoreductase subunit I [Desulfonauticus submarinus]|uniref:NADH-quinone oxidoreductase subunit I n=1 Tax=Desulfonauticus submarinus TaxID=206665 RepID=A0A1H0GFL7_9BACT|nr:4Fe-4S binding protein [Desulfonauticus submarinus]SDO05686.1 NADH-quinone oxidoreductase subunit I [Desulfonauticus submarinus]